MPSIVIPWPCHADTTPDMPAVRVDKLHDGPGLHAIGSGPEVGGQLLISLVPDVSQRGLVALLVRLPPVQRVPAAVEGGTNTGFCKAHVCEWPLKCPNARIV